MRVKASRVKIKTSQSYGSFKKANGQFRIYFVKKQNQIIEEDSA